MYISQISSGLILEMWTAVQNLIYSAPEVKSHGKCTFQRLKMNLILSTPILIAYSIIVVIQNVELYVLQIGKNVFAIIFYVLRLQLTLAA